MGIQRAVGRLLAVGYGCTYDGIVSGFRPYEALLDEIATLVARSCPGASSRASTKVLDITCGTGTVAFRLAREGYSVMGLDPVEHLILVARDKGRAQIRSSVTFHHLDLACDPAPGMGTFDVLVGMHSLYWHPNPSGLLAACRRALKPGGHGIFLTYSRPAHILRTFRQVWAGEGMRQAVRALRWLVPTAMFEMSRRIDRRYLDKEQFHHALTGAGFEVLESRQTFLAQISHLAWARTPEGEETRAHAEEGRR